MRCTFFRVAQISSVCNLAPAEKKGTKSQSPITKASRAGAPFQIPGHDAFHLGIPTALISLQEAAQQSTPTRVSSYLACRSPATLVSGYPVQFCTAWQRIYFGGARAHDCHDPSKLEGKLFRGACSPQGVASRPRAGRQSQAAVSSLPKVQPATRKGTRG